jgi:PAS domain S-box-containing protein
MSKIKKFFSHIFTLSFFKKNYPDALLLFGILLILFVIQQLLDPFIGFGGIPFLLPLGIVVLVTITRGFYVSLLMIFLTSFFFFLFSVGTSMEETQFLSISLRLIIFILESVFLTWLIDKLKQAEISARTDAHTLHRLNRELKQEVNHLQTLIKVLPIGVGIARNPNCKEIQINPAFAQLLRLPEENLRESNSARSSSPAFLVAHDGKVLEAERAIMLQSAQLGIPILGKEASIKHQDNQITQLLQYAAPIFDDLGRVIGSVGAFVDITERKRTEEELQESKERFELVVTATNETIWDWDIESDTVWWNDQLEATFGYNPKQVVKQSHWWEDVIHPEDKERVLEDFKHAIQSNKKLWEAEYRFQRSDGSYAYVLDRGYVLHDTKGKATRMIGAVLDITERKLIEKRKDEFISIASHELKTPLTTIKAYSQILEHHFQQNKDKESQLYLTKVNAYINKLIGLIGDLLDVSKIESGKLQLREEVFDFDQLIYSIISDLQLTSKSHRIIMEGETHQKILGDKLRIEQVISNLIANAIKYSPSADKVIIHIFSKGNNVVFSVQDFGIGIPKNKHKKIFEKFYRVDDAVQGFSGLGIGLFFSYEIIHRHKGKIWVKSKAGEGSTFFFELPVLSPNHEKNITASHSDSSSRE